MKHTLLYLLSVLLILSFSTGSNAGAGEVAANKVQDIGKQHEVKVLITFASTNAVWTISDPDFENIKFVGNLPNIRKEQESPFFAEFHVKGNGKINIGKAAIQYDRKKVFINGGLMEKAESAIVYEDGDVDFGVEYGTFK
jgi:hypothetical protein